MEKMKKKEKIEQFLSFTIFKRYKNLSISYITKNLYSFLCILDNYSISIYSFNLLMSHIKYLINFFSS